MKINQKAFVPDTKVAAKKAPKKEAEVKDQVNIGASEETPDFLKEPPISSNGCAKLGGAVGAAGGFFIGGAIGTADALIGLLAQKFGGEVGGLVASGVVGALHFAKGMNQEEAKPGDLKDQSTAAMMKVVTKGIGNKYANAAISGLTGAASTYMGARFGAAGLFYGGLATGVPNAVVGGIVLSRVGKQAGQVLNTATEAGGLLEQAVNGLDEMEK